MLNTSAVADIRYDMPACPEHSVKNIRLLLCVGSRFVFCKESPVVVIRSFIVDKLQVSERRVVWGAVDDRGRIFEGRFGGTVDLVQDKLTAHMVDPPVTHHTRTGFKAQFVFSLPHGYRVHHISYLREHYPGVV